jgi:hypothetical protein
MPHGGSDDGSDGSPVKGPGHGGPVEGPDHGSAHVDPVGGFDHGDPIGGPLGEADPVTLTCLVDLLRVDSTECIVKSCHLVEA